jgi:phosphonate transport system substrate-binding protein
MRTRHTRRRSTALVTAVAALLIASGCGHSVAEGTSGISGGDSPERVFVATPSLQPANLQQTYQPILKMLRAETGEEIRLQYATDYAAIITGLRQGKIQIAAMGSLSYVLAKRQGVQITVVAAHAKEKAQRPEYHSLGITPAGSPIKTLADFRGKRICFPDRYSTSGYLYPAAALLAVGIQPEHDITPIFAGGHDASVLAVANGQCDAGFAFDSLAGRWLIEQHQIQPGKIVTVCGVTADPRWADSDRQRLGSAASPAVDHGAPAARQRRLSGGARFLSRRMPDRRLRHVRLRAG